MTKNQNPSKDIQRYIEIDGQEVPVTEEVYRAYKRPLWAEHKRKERAKRCRDEKGNRCTKSCRKCPKLRAGGDLSLDRFNEDGFEIPDSVDVIEFVADKLLLEQLVGVLDDLDPDERSLINALFYNDRTERDYAAEVGISHQAIGKRKKKVIEKLRGLMGANNR